jgi:soluble lytic murein transglycosylase
MTHLLRLIALLCALMSTAARADEVQAMKTALDLAGAKQWEAALSTAPPGVGRDVILWQWLRTGEGRLGDYEDFLKRRPDWPGLPYLREKGEEAAARSDTPARVVAYFGADPPGTAQGAIALVRALLAQGNVARAETEAMGSWAELEFTAEEEDALLALQPEALAAVHSLRLENLLWAGRRAEALRMLPRVSTDRAALARARLALMAEEKGVDTLVAAVPKALQGDAGLAFDRFVYRMKKDNYDGAAELVLARDPAALGRPEAWAPRRATLARWLMRQGRADEAFRVAARHGLGAGSAYADLEFLSGFIALRKLGDPALALGHFNHLREGVSTPISIARGEYWKGRAEEAAGNKVAAESHYKAAARNQTAFYGLLAAERLGLTLDAALVSDTRPPDWRQSRFANASVLLAGRLLTAAGDRTLAKRFFLHLGESLDDAELAQLAGMAMQMDEPHIAVLIAKAAAERGVILPFAYYPVPDLVPAEGLKVSRALALAIARRESEFDPAARSHADARGLMQVLPATARRMADDLEIGYEAGKLLTDPAYNARLGSAYLAKMVDEFGNSIALVAAGYNAGPGRPRRWITEFGDPRAPGADVVDWIETIPFEETRTYVMRVTEGVVIYRAKLKGAAGPVRITAELRG